MNHDPTVHRFILDLIAAGKTVPAIVSLTGVNRSTIRKLAKRNGVRPAVQMRTKPRASNPFNRGPL